MTNDGDADAVNGGRGADGEETADGAADLGDPTVSNGSSAHLHRSSPQGHRFAPQAEISRSLGDKAKATWDQWRWIVRLVATVAVFAVAFAWVAVEAPRRIVGAPDIPLQDQLTAISQARTGILQGAAGLALLVGLIFTSRTTETARRGQITDRFSKAIEQLGDERIEVRIGSLYALEQIAFDSRRYRPVVRDVLVEFLRGRLASQDCLDLPYESDSIARDEQVALVIVGRRRGINAERTRVNLAEMNLPDARIEGDFRQASFYYGRLDRVIISSVSMRGAGFGSCRLRGAFLVHSDLRDSGFMDADCSGAMFHASNLTNSRMSYANLSHADLSRRRISEGAAVDTDVIVDGVDFTGANLHHANLRGADLRKSLGLTQAQIDSCFIDAYTKLPSGLTAPPASSS